MCLSIYLKLMTGFGKLEGSGGKLFGVRIGDANGGRRGSGGRDGKEDINRGSHRQTFVQRIVDVLTQSSADESSKGLNLQSGHVYASDGCDECIPRQ